MSTWGDSFNGGDHLSAVSLLTSEKSSMQPRLKVCLLTLFIYFLTSIIYIHRCALTLHSFVEHTDMWMFCYVFHHVLFLFLTLDLICFMFPLTWHELTSYSHLHCCLESDLKHKTKPRNQSESQESFFPFSSKHFLNGNGVTVGLGKDSLDIED